VIRDSLGRRLGWVTAEIVRENQAVEKEFHLLARVEVQPNEIVEFYEPEPGVIVISGAGAPHSPSPLGERMLSPAQAWRLAAPGFDIPAALRDAIERWKRREPTPRKEAEQPEVLGESSGGQPAPHRSGGWCDVDYFTIGWGKCPNYDFVDCLDNWWGGRYAKHSDAAQLITNVCAASDTVVFRVKYENSVGTWTVPWDSARYYANSDFACYHYLNDCPFASAAVQHAEGKRFHFRFLVAAE
jgi:hypothetical protein